MDKSFYQNIITDNLWSLYHLVAKELRLPNGISYSYCYVKSLPSPWPDFIYEATFKKEEAGKSITEIAGLAQNSLIPAFWITDPGFEDECKPKLVANGFKLVMKWPGMVYVADKPIICKRNDSVTIKKVETISELTSWFKIAEKNLFHGKSFQREYYNLLKVDGLLFYMVFFNQIPVGTVLVHTTGKTAGCYMVSVLEEYRNKGIAHAFMQKVIKQLFENKTEYIVLQANVESVKLYKKLGFNSIGDFDIYWKIGLF
jgi:ribosomal protein S18 acetylase RimI-like enzyme